MTGRKYIGTYRNMCAGTREFVTTYSLPAGRPVGIFYTPHPPGNWQLAKTCNNKPTTQLNWQRWNWQRWNWQHWQHWQPATHEPRNNH